MSKNKLNISCDNKINNDNDIEILDKNIYKFTQNDIDYIFINLRLITKIEAGNKICINNNFINIDTSYIKSISRWYYDINRNDNLIFVKNIINNSFLLNEELTLTKNISLLNRLNNEFKSIINGLINYKQTYSTDKLFQSEIDVLIENIKYKIEQNKIN